MTFTARPRGACGAKRVPRALGKAPFQVAGYEGERKLITFVQWKAQRARRAYEAAGGKADEWLSRFGEASEVIPKISNPFVRRDFKCVLADNP